MFTEGKIMTSAKNRENVFTINAVRRNIHHFRLSFDNSFCLAQTIILGERDSSKSFPVVILY